MIRKIARKIFGFKKNSDIQKYKMSYSQCGEDLIINYIFRLRGVSNPTYIDIGANDPFKLSNTALFYLNGSRGINVEANPNIFNKLENFRPDDINLNVGVGSTNAELDFFILSDPSLSTFSKKECDNFLEIGKCELSEIKKIKIITVQEIIDNYFKGIYPDFMSLDIEGMDFEVLKSIEFGLNSPKIICVEAAEYSPIGAGTRKVELIHYLEEKGYYEYANTNLNAIMVRKDFWFKDYTLEEKK